MLSSSERQVRSTGCMLNTAIRKTDNWRRSFAGLHCAAGQLEQAGASTGPNPQLSACHAMEIHAFNYDFKTLVSVCATSLPLCLLCRG